MTTDAAHARYPLTQGVNPWLVTVSVMLPTFMEVLDTAIASVALPYIAGSLSASNSEATWVLTSYLVANAVILPASNWFARRFGRKRFLLTCVVIFTIASFFCGAAPSLAVILLARVMQGAGGGALQPLSQSILLESFPAAKRVQGHGRLWPGHRGRAGARPHAGRLAHRHLQLALRVLHQHPGRHSGGHHDQPLRPRSAVHQERQGERLRQHRLRPADRLDRLPADRPRQGPGRRLVRRRLGALGGCGAGGRVRGVDLALLDQSQGPGRPARSQGSQLPHRLLHDCDAGHVHLHHHRHPAALLPGDSRLHGIHRRPGGGAARHRIVSLARRSSAFSVRASIPASCSAPDFSASASAPSSSARSISTSALTRCCCPSWSQASRSASCLCRWPP